MKNPIPKNAIERTEYVPIQKYWRKLKPLFAQTEHLWRPSMLEYMYERSREFRYPFTPPTRESEYIPADYDSCDWRFVGRGRKPAFWDYVCHSACHWLVDMNLYVAVRGFPGVPWRVVSSQKHSTVWNGDRKYPVLFDANFLALGIPPNEALASASTGRELKPGEYLRPWNYEALAA